MPDEKMNNRLILSAALLIFLILIKPVFAISCDLEKGEQYKIGSEVVELWGDIGVGNKEYCVFRYSGGSSVYSPIIIINEANKRETSDDNVKVAFGYLTGEYLRTEGPKVKGQLNSIYNGLSDESERHGNVALTAVAEAIKTAINTADICIDYKIINICMGENIKNWLFNRVGNFEISVKDWHEVLKTMGDMIFLIDHLQEKNLNYQSDVLRLYENTMSIKTFTLEIDNQLKTTYSNQLSYDFLGKGTEFAKEADIIPALIAERISAKQVEVKNTKVRVDYKLSTLADNISKIESINGNDEELKNNFCMLKKSDESLIQDEFYQKYMSQANDKERQIENLNERATQAYSEKIKNVNLIDNFIGIFKGIIWSIQRNIC